MISRLTLTNTTQALTHVAPTTSASFSSCDLDLWHVTLTFEFDLDSVKLNQRAVYVGHRSSSSQVIVRTHGHTHTHTHKSDRLLYTWTTTVTREKLNTNVTENKETTAWFRQQQAQLSQRDRAMLCPLKFCQLLHNCTKKSHENASNTWMILKITEGRSSEMVLFDMPCYTSY